MEPSPWYTIFDLSPYPVRVILAIIMALVTTGVFWVVTRKGERKPHYWELQAILLVLLIAYYLLLWPMKM